ncbi:TolC family protein [Leptospira borgpetersenii]|uniref:Outer membrane efflux protein n=1 Tax=Leptospira borgpetersenii str. Brem 328 TaxID=1049780 RepID=A0ABC9SCD9_LEPBO|nr:TolC family protein [Leptospira borgpetersenii]EMN11485.1 outer membrane efflux protein [Leptospira borgpetersenii str. Brem 307]EMN15381.1 outer membrane efflux protein [Leptospira borgpetersenii str. Brem 328]
MLSFLFVKSLQFRWIPVFVCFGIFHYMNLLEAKEKIILDIGSAERLGVENSPEIRLISSQQQIKRLLLNENWRAYFPTATVRWDRSHNIVSNTDDSRNQRLSLNVDQVVFDGGRRSLALDAAMSDLALAKYDLRLALNELRFKIRSKFYEVLSRKSAIEVYERSIDRQKQQLELGKKELELGESTVIRILEVENRLNEIKMQHENARMEYNNLLEDFKILLRLQANSELELKGDLLNSVKYNFIQFEEINLISLARKYRVDFDRAKAKELQTESQHRYAKSFYIPTVSLGGFYGYSGADYPPRQPEWGLNFRISMLMGPNQITDSSNFVSRRDDTDRSLSSSTTVSIYDQLSYKKQIVSTGVDAYQAKIASKQLGDIIETEIRKSLRGLNISWQSMRQEDENIIIFEKRLNIQELQVKLGEATRPQLAETEIRFLEAKNAQIGARLKYLNSIAQMELSTGLNLDDLHLFELQ